MFFFSSQIDKWHWNQLGPKHANSPAEEHIEAFGHFRLGVLVGNHQLGVMSVSHPPSMAPVGPVDQFSLSEALFVRSHMCHHHKGRNKGNVLERSRLQHPPKTQASLSNRGYIHMTVGFPGRVAGLTPLTLPLGQWFTWGKSFTSPKLAGGIGRE